MAYAVSKFLLEQTELIGNERGSALQLGFLRITEEPLAGVGFAVHQRWAGLRRLTDSLCITTKCGLARQPHRVLKANSAS